MLIVYPDGNKDGGNGKYIRPTPLISITQNSIKNKIGQMGSSYDITLNGTIVSRRESPIQDEFQEEIPTGIDLQQRLPEIIARQNEIREYFSQDGLYIEILDIEANAPKLSFYAKVNSVNFEEGIWVDTCRYSISLTADYLIDSNNNVTIDGIPSSGNIDTPVNGRKTVTELFLSSGLIEDFNDTWSIETDESNGSIVAGKFMPRSYRLTRNMSATGKNIYGFPAPDPPNPLNRKQAWEHARDFIKYHVDNSGGVYSSSINDILSSGLLLNMPSGYAGFNHIRSENLDKAAGTYSISDTYILSPSGERSLENYSLSIQSGRDNPFTKVSIDGNIKGLSPLAASGYLASGQVETPYDNAYDKYLKISNSGQFGVGCDLYKRANNSVASKLNAQPNSISLGVNETNGEITYNLEFDNRPTNYFSGVLSESINIQDTYPGDVFSVIPVIGRPTGPVLQYIGGRTEYKRDVTIEILIDYTDIGYNHDRTSLMLTKPSLNEPIRSQLNSLINDVGPATEPYIRKYFLNPPSESWSPKEGRYSLSLSWVYELDR
jgi:hypothetical protein